jgi:hypothetical protein
VLEKLGKTSKEIIAFGNHPPVKSS